MGAERGVVYFYGVLIAAYNFQAHLIIVFDFGDYRLPGL